MALVPTDDRFVIVPYLGPTKPSDATIIDNGIRFVSDGNNYYMGCISNSNNSWVVATTSGTKSPFGYCLLSLTGDYTLCDTQRNNFLINTPYVYNNNTYYYRWVGNPITSIGGLSSPQFNSFDEIFPALAGLTPPEGYMNIKYSIQNGSIIAPSVVAPGGNVTGYVTMAPGFSLTQQDISVTRNGTAIPFAFSNGVLTFTAPS